MPPPADILQAGAAALPSLDMVVACPPRPLGYRDLHAIRGTPAAVITAELARNRGASWSRVVDAYAESRHIAARDSAPLRYAWTAYTRACDEDGVPPIPVTQRSIMAMWFFRVMGLGRKSSALASYTSRVLRRAALLGHEVDTQTTTTIWEALGRFCEDFPCEVSTAAPPLGAADGRLPRVTEFAAQMAHTNLFYLEMHALLLLATELYPRASSLLDGHLRLQHILFQPPTPRRQGGLVVRLILPKMNKRTSDIRHDNYPVPMGPSVLVILSYLQALGLLDPAARPDAIVFPELDPANGTIVAPALSVTRSTDLLRRHIYNPSGVEGSGLLTLRSIRYGSSIDAAMSGVPEPERMAQGGWSSRSGASAYVIRSFAVLGSPSTTRVRYTEEALGGTIKCRVGGLAWHPLHTTPPIAFSLLPISIPTATASPLRYGWGGPVKRPRWGS